MPRNPRQGSTTVIGQSDDRAPGRDAPDHLHLLKVSEAAERCHLSIRHLRRMIKAGTLPVKRFGGAVRIHPKDLGI